MSKITKETLEAEVRRLRRPTVRDGLRDQVLSAAASARASGSRAALVRRFWSWRFAGLAAALTIVVAAGIWHVRLSPPAQRPDPPEVRQTQITRAPGDDIVVFWLDDDTPVFVSLIGGH